MVKETTFRKVIDNYKKNPIKVLTKIEQRDMKSNYEDRNRDRIIRVTNIFSSNQIKNSVQIQKKARYSPPPKILNQSTEYLSEAAKNYICARAQHGASSHHAAGAASRDRGAGTRHVC